MRLIKRLKTCLVLLLILSFSTTATAAPGKYITLNKGDRMPWKGWCFNGEAMAKVIADKEMAEQQCQLRLDRSKEELKADFDLEIGKLKAEMDYEVKTRQDAIDALKEENSKIEEAYIHQQKFAWMTHASLGMIAGALVVLLVQL